MTINAAIAVDDTRAALALAARSHARSVGALAELVRLRSLTGEEGDAQRHVAGLLESIGAEVTLAEPDIAALFRRFPDIAQYPTHWAARSDPALRPPADP